MRLVEVPVEELADTSREFFWAINSLEGVDVATTPSFDDYDYWATKWISPDAATTYYNYYRGFTDGTLALVWERV
jgi:hypothetical protein